MPSYLAFETSFVRTGGLLALAILMTGNSYFCTTLPNLKAQVAGWLGLVFFGLGTVLIATSLFRSGSRIIFDETGIHDLRIKGEPFSWDEISFLAIAEFHSQKFLSIFLRAEEERVSKLPAWRQRLCRLNKAMGLPAFNISFGGLTPGIEEAWNYIEMLHPEKVLKLPPEETPSNVPA